MEKLGDLINSELRKSGLSVQEFADKIPTTRGNVYKILHKGNIDVELLGRISKVLNHNFFADVARNLDLVNYEDDTSEEREKERAITQFLEVVPKVMNELRREAIIQFIAPSLPGSDIPQPDYFMSPYAITFTYGESYKNKLRGLLAEYPQILTTVSDDNGHCVEIINTYINDTQFCNIVIDYKTKDEWRECMGFALSVINQYYSPGNKLNLERAFKHRITW